MKPFKEWHLVSDGNYYAVRKYSWWGRKPLDRFADISPQSTYDWPSEYFDKYCKTDNINIAQRVLEIRNGMNSLKKIKYQPEEYV